MTLPSLNAADETALAALIAVRPVWRSLKRAGDAVGLDPNTLLHAGPAFASAAEITRPIYNSACIAAVFEGLARDFGAAEEAIAKGGIVLRPAQDFGVVTPLAAVVSASMWLHEVLDGNDPARTAFSPINGGNGPAMRLGIRGDDVLAHIRWLNGPFAETLAAALSGDVDLISLAAHGLSEGDDCHGRTIAATAELVRRLAPAIDRDAAARRFLDEGPAFFLNLWMAACKCMFAAAVGISGSSVIAAAGGNGATFGIQAAGAPGRWLTAPAAAPKGDLGHMPGDRALGAIGDSAIVDIAGFGAMALSYAPAQREVLGRYMPDDGLGLPELLLRKVHPGFGDLGLRMGLCACDVVAGGRAPVISLGILDIQGTAGRLGGGIYQTPMQPFAEAAELAAAGR